MLNTEINFKVGKKKVRFSLVHNLDEFGLSLDAAFLNWSHRTVNYSIDSFCAYVMSKDPENLLCVPKKVYECSKS